MLSKEKTKGNALQFFEGRRKKVETVPLRKDLLSQLKSGDVSYQTLELAEQLNLDQKFTKLVAILGGLNQIAGSKQDFPLAKELGPTNLIAMLNNYVKETDEGNRLLLEEEKEEKRQWAEYVSALEKIAGELIDATQSPPVATDYFRKEVLQNGFSIPMLVEGHVEGLDGYTDIFDLRDALSSELIRIGNNVMRERQNKPTISPSQTIAGQNNRL